MSLTLSEFKEEKEGKERKEKELADDDDEDNSTEPFEELILNDFHKLLNSKRLADVVFLVGKERVPIYAHKFILAAASEVFGTMLYPNPSFKDVRPAKPLKPSADIPNHMMQIEMTDTAPELVRLMLQSIYTNSGELELDQVSGAMKLARKYSLATLQDICSKFLEGGITVETACSMFQAGVDLVGDPLFGLDFIAENCKEVVETSAFVDLPKPKLLLILESNDLKIAELELFKAVVEWGKAECKRLEKKTTEKEDLKAALSDCLPLIRFPLMPLAEFSSVVTPLSLLPAQDQLSLYTYLAQKEQKKDLPSVNYSTEPRGYVGFRFIWARAGTRGLISDKGATLTASPGGYVCAIGDKPMNPNTGQYYWEILMTGFNPGDYTAAVGVCTQSLNCDSYLSASSFGWGYFSEGQRRHQAGSYDARFGENYTSGDTIGVLFDSDRGTLSFYRNRRSVGQAYDNIRQSVYPAVHFNGAGRGTINQKSVRIP